MKRIDTQFATGPVGLPIKTGSLNLLQDNVKELTAALVRSFTGIAPTGIQVLYGCVDTGVGGAVNISAGAVLYDGEIWFVDAAAFTPADTVIAVTDITFITSVSADPVTHTDNSAHNVNQVRKIKIIDGNSLTTDYIGDFTDFEYLTSDGWTSRAMVSGDFSNTGAGSTAFLDGVLSWRVLGKQVYVNFYLHVTQSVATSNSYKIVNPVNWPMTSVGYYSVGLLNSVDPVALTATVAVGPTSIINLAGTFAAGTHTITGQITFAIA